MGELGSESQSPPGPNTRESTCSGVATMTKNFAWPLLASLTEEDAEPPNSANFARAAGLTSNPWTEKPAFKRLDAMPKPIAPKPANPSCLVRCCIEGSILNDGRCEEKLTDSCSSSRDSAIKPMSTHSLAYLQKRNAVAERSVLCSRMIPGLERHATSEGGRTKPARLRHEVQ